MELTVHRSPFRWKSKFLGMALGSPCHPLATSFQPLPFLLTRSCSLQGYFRWTTSVTSLSQSPFLFFFFLFPSAHTLDFTSIPDHCSSNGDGYVSPSPPRHVSVTPELYLIKGPRPVMSCGLAVCLIHLLYVLFSSSSINNYGISEINGKTCLRKRSKTILYRSVYFLRRNCIFINNVYVHTLLHSMLVVAMYSSIKKLASHLCRL